MNSEIHEHTFIQDLVQTHYCHIAIPAYKFNQCLYKHSVRMIKIWEKGNPSKCGMVHRLVETCIVIHIQTYIGGLRVVRWVFSLALVISSVHNCLVARDIGTATANSPPLQTTTFFSSAYWFLPLEEYTKQELSRRVCGLLLAATVRFVFGIANFW